MFIRKTVKRYKYQTYTSYLLVESVSTPQGPRQRMICSLGDLSPGPREKWMGLANRIEAALQEQASLEEPDPLVDATHEWGSGGPGFKSRRPDQFPPFLSMP